MDGDEHASDYSSEHDSEHGNQHGIEYCERPVMNDVVVPGLGQPDTTLNKAMPSERMPMSAPHVDTFSHPTVELLQTSEGSRCHNALGPDTAPNLSQSRLAAGRCKQNDMSAEAPQLDSVSKHKSNSNHSDLPILGDNLESAGSVDPHVVVVASQILADSAAHACNDKSPSIDVQSEVRPEVDKVRHSTNQYPEMDERLWIQLNTAEHNIYQFLAVDFDITIEDLYTRMQRRMNDRLLENKIISFEMRLPDQPTKEPNFWVEKDDPDTREIILETASIMKRDTARRMKGDKFKVKRPRLRRNRMQR